MFPFTFSLAKSRSELQQGFVESWHTVLCEAVPGSQIHVELAHCPWSLQAGWPGHTTDITWLIKMVISMEKMLKISTELSNLRMASCTVTLSVWAMFHRQNSTKIGRRPIATMVGSSVNYTNTQQPCITLSMEGNHSRRFDFINRLNS